MDSECFTPLEEVSHRREVISESAVVDADGGDGGGEVEEEDEEGGQGLLLEEVLWARRIVGGDSDVAMFHAEDTKCQPEGRRCWCRKEEGGWK